MSRAADKAVTYRRLEVMISLHRRPDGIFRADLIRLHRHNATVIHAAINSLESFGYIKLDERRHHGRNQLYLSLTDGGKDALRSTLAHLNELLRMPGTCPRPRLGWDSEENRYARQRKGEPSLFEIEILIVLLKKSSLTTAEIAELTSAKSGSAYEVLRRLLRAGLVRQPQKHYYELTPAGVDYAFGAVSEVQRWFRAVNWG